MLRALALAAAIVVRPAAAPAQGDSAGAPLLTSRDALLAGAFAGATIAVMPLDRTFQRRLQLPSNQHGHFYGDAANVVRNLADPGTVIIGAGLYLAGRGSHNETMTDLGLHASEAIVAASAAGWLIKGVAGRARPWASPDDPHDFRFGRGFGANGDYQSFPSGHTLAAFALASELTAETSRRWPDHALAVGALTYSVASLSGISRMYDNAHWASDVVLGAGLGTLAGIAVERYQHTHPGNWVDRVLKHVSVAR